MSIETIDDLSEALREADYLPDRGLATALFLALSFEKPVLLEGEAHEDKFDEPALAGALETEAFYVGALGSRRNQKRRRERLLENGVSEEALGRIMGPSGLDIGADTLEETALSILSEILAVRAQRPGGFLKDAKQRIHVEVE